VKRIGIIFGGANSEHEVSINSARSVAANLDTDRFEAVLIGIGRDGCWNMVDSIEGLTNAAGGRRLPELEAIDIAFPVLHGRFGEDGTVQGLLELAGVPYVGCGVLASALAMDKLMAQRLLEASGIPTIPSQGITAATRNDAHELVGHLKYPLFVKPNRAGSSVGVTRVEDRSELRRAIDVALEHDRTALVQRAVDGFEVDLGVLQRVDGSLEVGAPLRINPSNSAFFDYEAKYTSGGADLEVPAQIPPHVSAQLVEYSKQAFLALDCEGLARVDFFVGDDNTITLNEVNTLPGMTAFSQYPRMWEAVGVGYTELLSRLLDRAVVAR